MNRFDVLNRELNIHRHYLLEASAGTGKTFSIQHLIVRLLIETDASHLPFQLNEILVVTFTRAATRELRKRIRTSLEQTVHHLDHFEMTNTVNESIPDYLIALIEKGKEVVQAAKKRVKQALFTFEQAQIFTIHGFCARMLRQHALESDMGLHTSDHEAALPPSEILSVVRDFFRTEMRPENYSPAQLEILLRGDPEQRKLLRAIQSHCDVIPLPRFELLFKRFTDIMLSLKQNFSPNAEQLLADFRAQSIYYRNYRAGETKAETLAKIEHFAQLFELDTWSVNDFDLLIRDELVWVYALDPKLAKKAHTASSSQIDWTQALRRDLLPLIEMAGDFSTLLARLAGECQTLLKRYQKEEEKWAADDLLKKMADVLDHREVASQIRSLYRVAIVDEFQDTDPLQWSLFRRLFLPEHDKWAGFLYLVGDPKQSIYSFRQADIYTYLAAAQALGATHCFSLDVNYRSHPDLVLALNTLFATEHFPNFIPLPKRGEHLLYQPVGTPSSSLPPLLSADRGAIHFILGDASQQRRAKLSDLETQVFFPFIAAELVRLHDENGLQWKQCAVLVRDRHQALRLAKFLDQCKIPHLNQRGTHLTDSPALASLMHVIRAILHPHNLSYLKAALGTPLIGWTHEDLKHLNEHILPCLMTVRHLHDTLFEKGFATFVRAFLTSLWRPDQPSVREQLLTQEGGRELYRDLQQLTDLVVDCQYRDWHGPEGLIPFLEQLTIWQDDEDERVKRFQDPLQDGVRILTLHFSKGLEFDVVFALGLVNRTPPQQGLVSLEKEGSWLLTPLDETSDDYMRYCEESDAEKMRQLYVALTRAKRRLYIPVPLHLPSEQIRYGEASPIDLFLARLGQFSTDYKNLYEIIRNRTDTHLHNFLDTIGKSHHMTYSLHHSYRFQTPLSQQMEPPLLHSPVSHELNYPPTIITSFTGLKSAAENNNVIPLTPPHDFTCQYKTTHTLPANRDTGVMIHTLLEKLSWSIFRYWTDVEEALSIVRPWLKATPFKEWETPLATLVFNALKTPLHLGMTPVCLAEVEPHLCYREIPFLFKEATNRRGANYIRGVVDTIFMHAGRYYIIDWKSNWLGPSTEYYGEEQMREAVKQHDYILQSQLYIEALQCYLKLIDDRPFEECFGGAYCLFLRGLQPGHTTGIYHLGSIN